MTLSAGPLRGLIAGLDELYSQATVADYPDRVIGVVLSMLPVDSCSYNHIGASGVLDWRVKPGDVTAFPDAAQLFRQHMHQHPVLASHRDTGNGAAQRISDFLSDRQFRSLGLHRDFYRPRGVNYQLGISVPAPDRGLIAIALNRELRDFSDDETELLDLLRPHLRQSAAIWHRLNTEEDTRADGVLTPRQARIVELIAAGHSDRAIGRVLGISTRTVHAHLRNIYRALDVTSRTEALARLRATSPRPA
jgi:DNA-binding CsgD family transcriptional regulator